MFKITLNKEFNLFYVRWFIITLKFGRRYQHTGSGAQFPFPFREKPLNLQKENILRRTSREGFHVDSAFLLFSRQTSSWVTHASLLSN